MVEEPINRSAKNLLPHTSGGFPPRHACRQFPDPHGSLVNVILQYWDKPGTTRLTATEETINGTVIVIVRPDKLALEKMSGLKMISYILLLVGIISSCSGKATNLVTPEELET